MTSAPAHQTPTIGPATMALEAALRRIAAPELQGAQVFTRLFAEDARRAAAVADLRRTEGRPLGPLDGRIVSVKALFDVAGDVTTAGSAVLRGQPAASRDARVVARLRAAGAVIVGKTNMTEFAFSGVGLNPHDGDPGNPHDRGRIAGGSSGGGVVSVVDGMAEIAIGSDTGGSVRIPAALSGAVGFKPTSGRVPTEGVFPLSSTLDVVGTIARTVADCALAHAVLADAAPVTAAALPLAGLRLVVPRGRLFDAVEPEVARAFADAIARLRAAGARVEDGSLDAELDAVAALDRIAFFPAIELAAKLAAIGVTDLAAIDPKVRARIEGCRAVPASDYVRLVQARAALVAQADARMASGEVLLLPTVPIVAPTIASLRDDAEFARVNGLLLRNPRIGNLLDLPAVSLPVASGGLPVGLMLMGRQGDDHRLLAVAAAVEPLAAG